MLLALPQSISSALSQALAHVHLVRTARLAIRAVSPFLVSKWNITLCSEASSQAGREMKAHDLLKIKISVPTSQAADRTSVQGVVIFQYLIESAWGCGPPGKLCGAVLGSCIYLWLFWASKHAPFCSVVVLRSTPWTLYIFPLHRSIKYFLQTERDRLESL